jgi:homogentisate 1,2-dioxygenase
MYLSGFGNHHQTELINNALPTNQNSPQKPPLNLFPEQISGSAFTRPRHTNLHSWLYRKFPSAVRSDYKLYSSNLQEKIATDQSPNPLRWSSRIAKTKSTDFLHGLNHIAHNLNNDFYIYQCNKSMNKCYFSNHDAEMLFIPYEGEIKLITELGVLKLSPGFIAVIPRGIAFRVELISSTTSGYLCENKGMPLTLPQLGPIGANGLASPRHFLYPKAAIEESDEPVDLFCQYLGKLWISKNNISPINVLAWHGNYAPYMYDLSLFNTINTVSFDHPDPSIFTVLTSESEIAGIANLDFVIFPPRWMVAENTFRPPYFHRNIMNELMGLVKGTYDAKNHGFEVGGVSIHNCMTPHGPDFASYKAASNKSLSPTYYNNTLAFMLETKDPWQYTEKAYKDKSRQLDYVDCWQGFI